MGPTRSPTGQIEVRRISRAVSAADSVASHNSSQDLYRAVFQMGGMWLGVQFDDYVGVFCSSVALNEMSLRYLRL